ncbi:MAG: oligosaccharide flippase family protein [Candidatus Aenigmatarchaeota archaeon]
MLDIKKFFQFSSQFSILFKASGTYTISSGIYSISNFILMLFFTHYLSPSEYGVISMINILVFIMSSLINCEIQGAIARVYFDRNKIDFSEYVTNSLILFIINTFVISFIMLIFREEISKLTGVPDNYFFPIIVISFFHVISLVALSIYQIKFKIQNYAFLQISKALLDVFLSIVFVSIFNLKWKGRVLGQLFSYTLIGLISFYSFKNLFKLKIRLDYLLHALKFGIPLIPHIIGGYFFSAIDKFLITNLFNLYETGIYTAGMQIGMIVMLFADSFNRAYSPWLFAKLSENNKSTKIKIVKLTYFYFIFILFMALLIGFISPYIVGFLLGKDFLSARKIIIWSALGSAFKGMYFMVTGYMFYTYKTYILTWITFFCGLLNIFISYCLIKLNGVIGGAQGYTLSMLIWFLFTWLIAAKIYKMPWDFKYND